MDPGSPVAQVVVRAAFGPAMNPSRDIPISTITLLIYLLPYSVAFDDIVGVGVAASSEGWSVGVEFAANNNRGLAQHGGDIWKTTISPASW